MRKSYTCLCPDGNVLSADEHSCEDDLKTPYLLVARKQQIIRLYPATIGRRAEEALPITGLQNVVSLDVDWSSQALFYSDVSKDVIVRMQLNNTNDSQVIAYRNIGTVEGLAVDWIAKNIYWTDAQKSVIEVARLDGSTRTILIDKDLEKPRGIAVDPLHGSLYFCDWGIHASIKHCDLAGTDCVYVAQRLGWPNNIVLDIAKAHIYWTDAKRGIIESARFDGYDRRVVTRLNPHPYSLSILQSTVFWTDWRTTSIHFADKEDGKNPGALNLDMADLMGIIAVTGENQLQVKTMGAALTCALAKRAAMKYTCMCPPGTALADDQHTCADSSQCGDNEFSCLDKCIPSVKLCDGTQDCPEGEDEALELCRVPCSEHEFTCTNGACINKEWLCDADNDCGDNSDEVGCVQATVCLANQFMCDNGARCIPLEWQCDGQSECDDGADEKDCETNTCLSTEFRCNSGKCIPSTWYCDGDPDCDNMEDEVPNCNAGMNCGLGQWHCGNGRCIDERWKCNGVDECGDNSDEESCGAVQNDCTGPNIFHCLSGCIPANWTCDGEKDCEDGEDEFNCTTLVTCEPTQFQCRHPALCIPERWTCDGENDCDDGSDEEVELCGTKPPSSTTTQLTSSTPG
ncbi:hypothetical protein NP493_127g02041 [Ridgeia piscesae]|uniref:Uncharacterized protein n=1 Tax=Ridgeia piscesae TaxID=27915 RepID=A0AAD9P5U9_RIDPI|nr:hypothetical protein NP493_127g02041 [Ridgeia piscesae]